MKALYQKNLTQHGKRQLRELQLLLDRQSQVGKIFSFIFN